MIDSSIPRALGASFAIAMAAFTMAGSAAASDAPPAAPPAALRALVDAAILPAMTKHAVPGMAVGVTVDGRSYVFNYGVASRESGAPVDDATLFEIGSVSKTFTATLGALALVDGRLSLSDSPGRFLPALRGHAVDRTTLLQLATYTAGGFPLQVPDGVPDEAALARYLARWQPAFTPGTQRVYSNPSIGLFGRAVAASMKMDFSRAIESELLPPLGLRDTHIPVSAGAMPHYAWGHDKDEAVRVRPDVFDAEAYGIKTTAADLLRFVRLNIDPSSAPPRLARAIAATQLPRFQVAGMTQGLGWEQYPWPVSREQLLAGNALSRGATAAVPVSDSAAADAAAAAVGATRATSDAPRLFNKTGSTRGFGSYVLFVPEQRLGLVLLANRAWPTPARIELGLALLEQLQQLPRQPSAQSSAQRPAQPSARQSGQ